VFVGGRNVCRRDDSASWQKYDNGGWANTDKPAQGRGDARASGRHGRPLETVVARRQLGEPPTPLASMTAIARRRTPSLRA
jgi:hypothetical protein